MPRSRSHAFLLLLFFLSGIPGLVYQIVWTRNLVLVFGNTMLATSTVLSAFMGGLAAGSYFVGRFIDRRPWPLVRLYAGLEAGIGLYALIFPALLGACTPLYTAVYPAVDGNVVALNLVRFLVCFLIIAVPTFMMGATLPVLIKFFVEQGSEIGRRTGLLYGLNTLGAVVGTVACGYVLLQHLGMRGATWVGVGVNLGVAALAWVVADRVSAGREEGHVASTEPSRVAPARDEFIPIRPRTTRLVMLGIGISGFCALAYEVFWTRMLNLFLHNNVYSFTAILATFLVGIAVGSFLYYRTLSRLRDQLSLFVGLQIAIGVFAYATPYVFQVFHGSIFNNFAESYTLAKTAAIMVAPTILMGVAVPLAVQICRRGEDQEGTSVGTVYAANTVGSILGAFLAGFLLLPTIGLHHGIILVASLNLLAGVLPALSETRPSRRPVWAAVVVLLVAGGMLAAPENLFRGLFERSHPSADILHYKEGRVANVVVYDFYKNGYKDMHLNAVEEASSRIWHVQLFKLLGILPPLTHPDPDDALMIAFGAGMSAGATIKNVEEFTVVDLNPDIDGIAREFTRENLDVINNPKLERVVNDGRNELLLNDRKYSLIISDATNPKMFDSWTLYSREFYELVKERLEPDGIFCQWLLMPLPSDSIKELLNTFRSVFPHMSFWSIYGSSQCMFMATPERLDLDYADLAARLEPILEPQGLTEFGVDSVEKFLSFFVFADDGARALLQDFDTISTDDLPHPQFHVTQDAEGVEHCIDVIRHQESVLKYMSNLDAAPEGFVQRTEALGEIGRRLNLAFLTGDPNFDREAAFIASREGIDDENVKMRFFHDRERQRYFEQRTRVQPDDANAHNSLAYIYRMEGDLERAESSCRRALELAPRMSAAHSNLIQIHIARGQYDLAEQQLAELARSNPTRSNLRMVDRERARLRILRRLRHEPESLDLHRQLAAMHYRAGRLTESIHRYRQALAIDARDVESLRALVTIFERHGMAGELAETYGRLAALMPEDGGMRAKQLQFAQLGDDPASLRRWQDQRIPDVRLTASSSPDHPGFCDEALARWQDSDYEDGVDVENLRRAARLYSRTLSDHPADLHAYVDAATLREVLGEYEVAARLWEGLGQQSANWATAAGLQSRRLQLLADVENEELDAEEKAAALAQVASLHSRLGEFEKALGYLEEALELEPEQGALWSRLGANRAEIGAYEAAIDAAERAQDLDPDQEEARALLQELSGVVTR